MKCGECKYWISEHPWEGQCRRHAPTRKMIVQLAGSYHGSEIHDTVFPVVSDQWFCGDFIRK